MITSLVGNKKSVLDVGCGDGLITEKVGKKNKVIGIDLEHSGLKLAKNKSFHVEGYILGDAFNLPFKNNHFDMVIMNDVIEHVENPKKLVRECHKVTKKEGLILITTPLKRKSGLLHDRYHIQEFSINELIDLVKEYYSKKNLKIITTKRKRTIESIFRCFYPFISKLEPLCKFYKKFRGGLIPNSTSMSIPVSIYFPTRKIFQNENTKKELLKSIFKEYNIESVKNYKILKNEKNQWKMVVIRSKYFKLIKNGKKIDVYPFRKSSRDIIFVGKKII